MNRRGLGRGRALAALGAAIALVGCVPAWYTVGGELLPARSSNAFDGAGILVFVAAIALVALVALPYAAGDDVGSLDRPLIFGLVAALGVVGFLLRVVQLLAAGVDPAADLNPARAPGLWVAGLGLAIAAWGVGEVVAERSRS